MCYRLIMYALVLSFCIMKFTDASSLVDLISQLLAVVSGISFAGRRSSDCRSGGQGTRRDRRQLGGLGRRQAPLSQGRRQLGGDLERASSCWREAAVSVASHTRKKRRSPCPGQPPSYRSTSALGRSTRALVIDGDASGPGFRSGDLSRSFSLCAAGPWHPASERRR